MLRLLGALLLAGGAGALGFSAAARLSRRTAKQEANGSAAAKAAALSVCRASRRSLPFPQNLVE